MRTVRRVAAGALFLVLASTAPGAGLAIRLAGPTSGPIATGVGVEDANVGDSITFTISFDTAAAVKGYDLTVQ